MFRRLAFQSAILDAWFALSGFHIEHAFDPLRPVDVLKRRLGGYAL